MRYRDRHTRDVSLERAYELALIGDESDAIEEARLESAPRRVIEEDVYTLRMQALDARHSFDGELA